MTVRCSLTLATLLLLAPMIEAELAKRSAQGDSALNVNVAPYGEVRLTIEHAGHTVGIELGTPAFPWMRVMRWKPDQHHFLHPDYRVLKDCEWRETPERMAEEVLDIVRDFLDAQGDFA